MTTRLALVQYQPPKGDPVAGREGLTALTEQAGRQGADLIVLPEMATCGYVWRDPDEVRPHCELPHGPTYEALAPVARAHGAWVVCGLPELGQDGLYNSALVIDHTGALVDVYRKVLLFETDHTWARAGRRRPVYETPFGRMTPGICMDLNDDRFALHLLRERPDVVAFCTNWVEQGLDILPYWVMRLCGWRGWFVAADTWGRDRHIQFYGRSAILAPGGRPVAMAGPRGDGVLVVEAEGLG